VRGTSPEFWGRAIGWYMMAVPDVLDYLPKDHPRRQALVKILQDLSAALAKYQDPKTGLWYQIVDKGDRPDDWLETSCSAMFAYGMAKGARQGYLDPKFMETAKKAWRGLLNQMVYFDEQDRLWLLGTVEVGSLSGKADYSYYVTVPRVPNDQKGVAAMLYLGMEIEGLKPKS
jgi:unsaturated rhamnogalacturonyl hydrolase